MSEKPKGIQETIANISNLDSEYITLRNTIQSFGEDIINKEQKKTLLDSLEKIRHSPNFQKVCQEISDAIKVCDGQNAAVMRATIEKYMTMLP